MKITLKQKKIFARAFLEKRDHYQAALVATKGDSKLALVMSRKLENDPQINTLIADAEKENDDYGIPTKNTVVRKIWDKAINCRQAEEAFKGYKLVAEILGYINNNNNNTINNTLVDNCKVMIVTDHGSSEQWEAKLAAQQAALVNESSR